MSATSSHHRSTPEKEKTEIRRLSKLKKPKDGRALPEGHERNFGKEKQN